MLILQRITSWLLWKEASLAFGNFGMEGIYGHSRNMWAEYPRFSMALHLDVSFLSWSLCCGLRGVFKTNVSWRAWGPQGRMTISGTCRQNYGALTTLAARNPASRCPSPRPGPCFSGARPRPRVWAASARSGGSWHITGRLCSIGFPSASRDVCLVWGGSVFLFSDLPCNPILRWYVTVGPFGQAHAWRFGKTVFALFWGLLALCFLRFSSLPFEILLDGSSVSVKYKSDGWLWSREVFDTCWRES